MKIYDFANILNMDEILKKDNDGVIMNVSKQVVLLKKVGGQTQHFEWPEDDTKGFSFILDEDIVSVKQGNTVDEAIVSNGVNGWRAEIIDEKLKITPIIGPMPKN